MVTASTVRLLLALSVTSRQRSIVVASLIGR
jgi:hypothetical protein